MYSDHDSDSDQIQYIIWLHYILLYIKSKVKIDQIDGSTNKKDNIKQRIVLQTFKPAGMELMSQKINRK